MQAAVVLERIGVARPQSAQVEQAAVEMLTIKHQVLTRLQTLVQAAVAARTVGFSRHKAAEMVHLEL
jgi:hypothetical protein